MTRCYILNGINATQGCHNDEMQSTIQIAGDDALRRIRQIQALTIAWMSTEAAVSLAAAWRAHSPALGAFGGDSVVELLSAAIVLWRFRAHARDDAERLACRVAGVLLFALAACVVVVSGVSLFGYSKPKPSFLGIAVLLAAAVIMPWLATQKRNLSAITNSAALRADAAQSAFCGYLALIALLGLAVEAVWKVSWADPVAALILTPLIVHEGREALQGKACGCC